MVPQSDWNLNRYNSQTFRLPPMVCLLCVFLRRFVEHKVKRQRVHEPALAVDESEDV